MSSDIGYHSGDECGIYKGLQAVPNTAGCDSRSRTRMNTTQKGFQRPSLDKKQNAPLIEGCDSTHGHEEWPQSRRLWNLNLGPPLENPVIPPLGHIFELLIENYPYASDEILIWEAVQNWIQTYVTRYSSLVCNDRELQAWYAEVINVGHANLRHENWWPTLANAEDLTAILTTIIWLASAHHAALNFGQYPYGGYIPNRPPRMLRLIHDENDPEYTNFPEDPQNYFLLALPSMLQSTKYMAVVDTLSTHLSDEEYISEIQQRDTCSGDNGGSVLRVRIRDSEDREGD
uniref:Linoleate 13S-lipoxygenase 3-1, chloroplastic-like n=1 Tax=Tanacetum cinerariifolium TaxID=118510 RepID=A0A699HB71_TANCI|nr:linoleate 13S-lipoxygenase 3-1, chloroplastic-like [Tanacetum cinerariifolium]